MLPQKTYGLSAIIQTPGGRTAAELVARADAGLARNKDEIMAFFDGAIDDLTRQTGAAEMERAEAYRSAMVVTELGALVGHPAVGRAAVLLCDWLEDADDAGPALRQGVQVHVEAITVLRRAEPGADGQGMLLLKGLEIMGRKRAATRGG